MKLINTYCGYAAYEQGINVKQYEFTARSFTDDDIEIKITHCGICATDTSIINGDWGPTKFPIIPGHEIIGKVVYVGKNVDSKKYALGKRVGVGAQCNCCQKCDDCLNSKENLCRKMVATYHGKERDGSITQGGYCNYYRCNHKFVFLIPDALSSESAAPLMCAGITVYSPLVKFQASVGTNVGVIGIGGLGHLALQFANKMGCTVTAISSSEKKKNDAFQFGAKYFLNTSEKNNYKKFYGKFDIILNTAAFGEDTDWAELFRLLKADGTFVMLGVAVTPLLVNGLLLISRQVSITGSSIGSPKIIEEMLQYVVVHNIQAKIEKFAMKDCNRALKKMKYGGGGNYRIVLCNEEEINDKNITLDMKIFKYNFILILIFCLLNVTSKKFYSRRLLEKKGKTSQNSKRENLYLAHSNSTITSNKIINPTSTSVKTHDLQELKVKSKNSHFYTGLFTDVLPMTAFNDSFIATKTVTVTSTAEIPMETKFMTSLSRRNRFSSKTTIETFTTITIPELTYTRPAETIEKVIFEPTKVVKILVDGTNTITVAQTSFNIITQLTTLEETIITMSEVMGTSILNRPKANRVIETSTLTFSFTRTTTAASSA
ncbi:hypothetical protein HDU92_000427 [Lobulomyces angularis]|nr:hypothetical protein HDU92_000427 [Lobulomyces angularis]